MVIRPCRERQSVCYPRVLQTDLLPYFLFNKASDSLFYRRFIFAPLSLSAVLSTFPASPSVAFIFLNGKIGTCAAHNHNPS